MASGVVAPAPDRDLEAPGLPEAERHRHVVGVDAAGDRRRAAIDQQVEAEACPLVLAVAFDQHFAHKGITEFV